MIRILPAMSAALFVAVVATGWLGACKQHGPATGTNGDPPPSPTGSSGDIHITPKAAVPADATAPPAPDEAVLATLKAMSVRRNCNRVMGCKAATELMGHGAKAIPTVEDLVARNPRLDKWWLVKAIDVVGQLKDVRAVPMLSALLTDWRPELRARAAMGLARIGDPSARPALLKAAKQPADKTDPATRGAIDFALARTARGKEQAGSYREDFLSRWPKGKSESDKTLATIVGVLSEIAREWPVKQALAQLRLALDHPSSFARIEAIRAVGHLRDSASIPSLMRRLDDVLPSQRRAAMKALGQIAQAPSLTTVGAWKRWCAQRRCLEAAPGL